MSDLCFREWLELNEDMTRRGFLGAMGAGAVAMAIPGMTQAAEPNLDNTKLAYAAWERQWDKIPKDMLEMVKFGTESLTTDSKDLVEQFKHFSKPPRSGSGKPMPDQIETWDVVRKCLEMELIARSSKRSLSIYLNKHPDPEMKTFVTKVAFGLTKPKGKVKDIDIIGADEKGFQFGSSDNAADSLRGLLK